MTKIYCFICGKRKNFEKPKISYILEKTLVPCIICSKSKNDGKINWDIKNYWFNYKYGSRI